MAKRSKQAYEGTLTRGVRQRVDPLTDPDVTDVDEAPEAVALRNASGDLHRQMYLMRHPDSFVDQKRLRDAVPPPPGYCYTLDGRLVPLLEVRLPKDDPTAQGLFCEVLEVTGSFRAACDTLGIKREREMMDYMTTDIEFAEAVNAAAARHRDRLYAVALQRATTGYQKPIIGGKDRDKIVGYETVVSDSLLVLLLKRHFPEFREATRANLSVTNNTMNVTMPDPRKLSREKRNQLEALLAEDVPDGDPNGIIDVPADEADPSNMDSDKNSGDN